MIPTRKLTFDPMPALIEERKAAVNKNFATMALTDLHRDQAHDLKRRWATSDRAKLGPEAELHGITVDQLAEIILSKADDAVAARELKRQQIMKRIEAATCPADLDAI